jgi:hypothetical protein
MDREIHRIGDEAKIVSSLMDFFGPLDGAGDSNMRSKCHPEETTVAIGRLFQRALGAIFVRNDHDTGYGAEVQIPEHVTARERCNEEFFRIVSSRISSKFWVGRTGDRDLSWNVDLMVSRVRSIIGGTFTCITGPYHVDGVVMFPIHRLSSKEATDDSMELFSDDCLSSQNTPPRRSPMRSKFFFALTWFVFSTMAIAQDKAQLQIGGATIDVSIDPAPSPDLRKLILDWIATAARAVTTYYTKYAVPHVAIAVNLEDGGRVNSGRAFGWQQAHISISVGRLMTAAGFADDWTITHEMVHLAFPSVAENHHWIEEGLATYVEPIARARAGDLLPQKVWGDMVDAMGQGLPMPGDRGLDFTHTWGRTYWGGALYCLLADIEIRKRTQNRFGLEDAMRGILKAGGSIEVEWPLARALKVADQAVGVPVLEELYDRMKATPVTPDLHQLWKDLGVDRQGETVVFDDSAPLASIRRAITSRSVVSSQ